MKASENWKTIIEDS